MRSGLGYGPPFGHVSSVGGATVAAVGGYGLLGWPVNMGCCRTCSRPLRGERQGLPPLPAATVKRQADRDRHG